MTKLVCHVDTAGTTMATFHVTAFPKAAATGNVELKLNQTTRTLTAAGSDVVATGIQITTDDTVGPPLKLELKQAQAGLASGEVDATCLKKKVK